MLDIKLSGYNVDADVLKDMAAQGNQRNDITPEILSASYARIIRDPRPVNELRIAARKEVEKARKSNKAIIFKMGHHSVAEHAVFNFDVMGISRFALEELEKFRLCSFTEKSQRYINLEDNFVVPEEIQNTSVEKKFRAIAHKQFALYERLFQNLKKYVFDKNPDLAKDPKNQSVLEGWAKEDARYITPLAAEAQLGMTMNARNLELILRRFASNPLKEVQSAGQKFYSEVALIAPSIILFHKANDFDQHTCTRLKSYIDGNAAFPASSNTSAPVQNVMRVSHTPQADEMVLSALIQTVSDMSFNDIQMLVHNLGEEEKKSLFKEALAYLEFYDTLPREFEHASIMYQLIVSAACFGQLKRHRMATITSHTYDPKWGVVIPETIKKIGFEQEFVILIEETNAFYKDLYLEAPLIAPYILTNAHQKKLLITVNARELYHMSRLREDSHAQWDIRRMTAEMVAQAKEVMPLTMLLVGGKDSFMEIYKTVYGAYPKISPPETTIKNKTEVS
ncbi:MAG: FAD-dependent thymidylate synthase [bacterium]